MASPTTDNVQRPSLVNIFQQSKPELDGHTHDSRPLTAEEKSAFSGALDVMVNYVVSLQGGIAPGGGKSFLKELNVAPNDPNRAKYVAIFRAITEMNPNDSATTLTEKVEQEMMKNCPAARPTLVAIYQESKARLGNFMFKDDGTERPLTAKEKAAMEKAIDAMVEIIKAGQNKIAPNGGTSFLKALNVSANDPNRAKYIALFRAVTEMNPSDTTVTLTEKVEKKLMDRVCVKPTVTPADTAPAPAAVTLSNVAPYDMRQGDEVTLVLTGDGLDQVTGIKQPTGFPDLGQPEYDKDAKQLKFPPVTVPFGMGTGKQEFVLLGGADANEKLASFEVNILGGDPRTAFEKAGDYVANTLKVKGEAAAGLSNYPNVSAKVPYDLRALGDREMPNLKLDLRAGTMDDPVTVVGRGKAIAPISERVELLGNARFGVQDAVHNGKDSYRLSAGLGLGVRGNPLISASGRRLISLGAYVEGSIADNANAAPNKFFYNGTDKTLNARLTLDSEFGGLFAERQYTSFNWDGNSFPGGFSGQTEKWLLGALSNVDLSQRSPWQPKISAKAAWIASGRTSVPDAMAGFAYENLTGVEAEARVDFKKMPKVPFSAFGGLQYLTQDGDNWGAVSRYWFGFGLKNPKAGALEARADFASNPALYYGGSARFGTLAYTLPDSWKQASGLTLKVQGYKIADQTGVNGVVSLDLVPLIFGPIKTYTPVQTGK